MSIYGLALVVYVTLVFIRRQSREDGSRLSCIDFHMPIQAHERVSTL